MPATDHASNWITADQPITDRTDDRLSRAQFARELATAMGNWTGNSALTIAVYGSWGSGKSSVKNMAIQYLKELPEPAPTVVEFNPWRWNNSDQLAEAFFREVGKGLGTGDDAAKSARLARQWRKYAALFSAGAALTSVFQKVVGWSLMILSGLSVFGYIFLPSTPARILVALIVLVFLAGALLSSGTAADAVSKYFDAKSAADTPSLESLRSQVEVTLRGRSSPIVVILDDIDRLAADQIALLFRLIKANGDLPRFVYVLLFQRDIVEKCLGDISGGDGGNSWKKWFRSVSIFQR